jgi:hypothetical protein
MVVPRDRAVVQLCAPQPGEVYADPAVQGAAEAMDAGIHCGDERFVCTAGWVAACEPMRVVARCIKGCSGEALTLDDEALTDEAAIALLCRRR